MFLFTLFTLMAVAVMFGAISIGTKDPAKRQRLTGMSKLLGGGHDLGGDTAWGTALGAPTTIAFVERQPEEGGAQWTEISVQLPRGYPLLLRLHRMRHVDEADLAQGAAERVEWGDVPFDAAFFVEGAPAAVVKHLLDAEARAFLERCPDVELSLAGLELSLKVQGWLQTEEAATPALEFANRLAARLPEVFARVERENQAVRGGSPFRAEPDAERVQAAEEQQRAELQRLEQRQLARARGLSARQLVTPAIVAALAALATLTGRGC